jgi:transcriptional regulator with XRE-family HTH domain
LGVKSHNDYAQYEQGKHMPSIDTLEKFLQAIDPKTQTYITCAHLPKPN